MIIARPDEFECKKFEKARYSGVMDHRRVVRSEFERAAPTFGDRTRGRFDDMDVVAFSRIRSGMSVMEVGAGTGNFLALFDGFPRATVAVDLTPAMLREARNRVGSLRAVAADGARLPFATGSIDLVTCAQMLHHVENPIEIIKEMKRVARSKVLVVDQVATEDVGEIAAMNEIEKLRDPSHAHSRPPTVLRKLLSDAGLDLIDERIVSARETFSQWMWPGEFPEDRIDAVRAFVEHRGHETGMEFEESGNDFVYTRRRIMLLAG